MVQLSLTQLERFAALYAFSIVTQYTDLCPSFHMHQKKATFDIKTEKFATSSNTRRSSIPCKTPFGEDEFDEEFPQNHESRGASKGLQTNA